MDKHIKTGRTHLMDAMPLRLSQEMGGWATQMRKGINRLHAAEKKHVDVGTRRHRRRHRHQHRPRFAELFARRLKKATGAPFIPNSSFFESLSAQDAAVEMSGQLKTVAVSLMKISNDLRWMNSGPLPDLAKSHYRVTAG